MIDDDLKFFRENFSASSHSDFPQSPRKSNVYETKPSKLQAPQQKRKMRQSNNSFNRDVERFSQKLDESHQASIKATQYKILHKLKSQHESIKHLNPLLQEQIVQQQKFKPKSIKPRRSKVQQLMKQPISRIEHRQERQQKQKQKTKFEQRQSQSLTQFHSSMNNQKTKQLQYKIIQKQRLINKLRTSEQQIVQQYKNQISNFKVQIDKLVDENTRLKKQLITKDLENSQLKQQLRRKQTDQKSVILEKELHMSRNKEMEYLQAIRLHQKQDTKRSASQAQMNSEINFLRQRLVQNNGQWQKKLEQALQRERKSNMQVVQKMLSQQANSIAAMNATLKSNLQFQQSQAIHTENIIYNSPPISPQQPIINTQIQNTRNERVLQILIQQLQQLRRPYNPIEYELRSIKDSIKGLMRSDYNTKRDYKDLTHTADSLQMVNQLQNLKMFIIKQQNSRKNYTDELYFFRTQHNTLVQQNNRFKTQSQTLRQDLQQANKELYILRKTTNQQQIKLQQKARYTEQLANSLAIIQSSQIDSYAKIKSNIDRQRSHQLENQIQQLKTLLQSQVLQMTKTHDEKLKNLQQIIQSLERKNISYQDTIKTLQLQLLQKQTQYQTFQKTSKKDILVLREANKRLQQQAVSYRNQANSVSTNNLQLKTQIKQRSNAVDHLWLIKKAQFDNVLGQLGRLKEGFI